eukprot:scaffold24057_cov20-Tisochrysis_lutea.AAC.1
MSGAPDFQMSSNFRGALLAKEKEMKALIKVGLVRLCLLVNAKSHMECDKACRNASGFGQYYILSVKKHAGMQAIWLLRLDLGDQVHGSVLMNFCLISCQHFNTAAWKFMPPIRCAQCTAPHHPFLQADKKPTVGGMPIHEPNPWLDHITGRSSNPFGSQAGAPVRPAPLFGQQPAAPAAGPFGMGGMSPTPAFGMAAAQAAPPPAFGPGAQRAPG